MLHNGKPVVVTTCDPGSVYSSFQGDDYRNKCFIKCLLEFIKDNKPPWFLEAYIERIDSVSRMTGNDKIDILSEEINDDGWPSLVEPVKNMLEEMQISLEVYIDVPDMSRSCNILVPGGFFRCDDAGSIRSDMSTSSSDGFDKGFNKGFDKGSTMRVLITTQGAEHFHLITDMKMSDDRVSISSGLTGSSGLSGSSGSSSSSAFSTPRSSFASSVSSASSQSRPVTYAEKAASFPRSFGSPGSSWNSGSLRSSSSASSYMSPRSPTSPTSPRCSSAYLPSTSTATHPSQVQRLQELLDMEMQRAIERSKIEQ